MSETKEFDAVKMMREIRDELSRELVTMNHEEQRAYLDDQLRYADPAQQAQRHRTKTTA